MKQKEIVVGGIYAVKVSGRQAPVRVTEVGTRLVYKRWVGTCVPVERFLALGVNLQTGRRLRFRSAQRFICPINTAGRVGVEEGGAR